MNKKSAIEKPKVSINGFSTDAEKILGYLEGRYPKSELNRKVLEKLERIIQAKSWLLEHKFQHKVVELMVQFYEYSEITAYRDLKLMSRVFGPVMQVHKDLKRAIADKMIEETWKDAADKKDLKAQNQLIKNYIALHQLDKDDPELPDLSSYEFQPVIIAVLPEQVGQNPPNEEELSDRLSSWFQDQSEEVESEEAWKQKPSTIMFPKLPIT